jgi:hypothetical protein
LTTEAIPSGALGADRPPRRLLAAGLIGRTANEMTPVAVVLLVLARGQGAALAGVTAGALALPGVITGPVLGAWLDRARRPLAVIAAEQAVGAAGLAALAVAVGHVPAALTILLAAATGALQPLSTGGMTSVLTGLSDEEYLPRATSFEAASFGTASVAGPMLAALIAGVGGAALAVATQSVLKVTAMLVTVGAPGSGPDRPDAAQATEPIGATVAAGFRHFASRGPLAAVTVTGSLVMAGRGLFTVAFPLYAVHELGHGQSFAGVLWAAFAAGSAVGALALTRRTARWPSHWVCVLGAALAGSALAPVALVGVSVVAIVLLVIAGTVYGPSLAATFDVRRRFTPARFLGQVFTTAASVKNGSFASGAAVSGAVVAGLGAPETIALGAGIHLVGAVAGAVLLESSAR